MVLFKIKLRAKNTSKLKKKNDEISQIDNRNQTRRVHFLNFMQKVTFYFIARFYPLESIFSLEFRDTCMTHAQKDNSFHRPTKTTLENILVLFTAKLWFFEQGIVLQWAGCITAFLHSIVTTCDSNEKLIFGPVGTH